MTLGVHFFEDIEILGNKGGFPCKIASSEL